MKEYEVKEIIKYDIKPLECSEKFHDRKLIGCGSSLTINYENGEEISLYMLTDRGPNLEGPVIKKEKTKVFLIPEFNPHIIEIKIGGKKAELTKRISLMDSKNKKYTGLPKIKNKELVEKAVDERLKPIEVNVGGIDPEGVAKDEFGNIWVCEEYGPSIIKFSSEGVEELRLEPGEGIPKIYNEIFPNRGFEAITSNNNGKLYIASQSVLDINSETREKARFIRIIEIDIESMKSKEYGYLFDHNKYEFNIDAKIGDMYAIDEDRIVLIEQGKSKTQDNGDTVRNIIYMISLEGATDLSDYFIDGKLPEYCDDMEKLSKINFVGKKEILDLRKEGWPFYKAEGIAVSKDRKRIFVINDNDFGIDARGLDYNHKPIEDEIFNLIYEKGEFFNISGENLKCELEYFDTKEELQLWEIQLGDML